MYLVHESLLKGGFPKSWKMSIVHPLLKTLSSVFNLRSISVLPAIFMTGKVGHSPDSESTLNSRTSFQSLSRYRKDHSTCTALMNACLGTCTRREMPAPSSAFIARFFLAIRIVQFFGLVPIWWSDK